MFYFSYSYKKTQNGKQLRWHFQVSQEGWADSWRTSLGWLIWLQSLWSFFKNKSYVPKDMWIERVKSETSAISRYNNRIFGKGGIWM